jgi:hypothetical protein
MAFERNKKSRNPNFGKKMTVADMKHPFLEDLNKEALALLDKLDKEKCRLFKKKRR